MPYHIISHEGEHCVAKQGEDMPIPGGCHPTLEEAQRHMAALYANVPDASAKAGASISRANMTRLQSMHDMAVQMGAQCDMGNAPHDYTPIGKAGDLILLDDGNVYKAVTKTEADGQHPASHYLVVEDPEQPSKWHLRVKNAAGDLDRGLMGAAWAALHGGYRGNEYQGPGKQEAIAKLKRFYAQVGAEAPSTTKAGALIDTDEGETFYATIKALGDRTLELRVAWGWDNHREQFTPQTDFDLENFPTPPVAYYHGYTEKSKPATKPVYIGKTIKRENRADGHYLTAKLNKKPEADRVWAAALKGEAVVSPATAGHLRRKAGDGTLTYWPIVEISAWDGAPDRRQAHPQSLAFPVLKALYQEAGVDIPAPLTHTPPEAAGDAASAGADIPLDQAGPVIAAEVARAMLQLHKEHS